MLRLGDYRVGTAHRDIWPSPLQILYLYELFNSWPFSSFLPQCMFPRQSSCHSTSLPILTLERFTKVAYSCCETIRRDASKWAAHFIRLIFIGRSYSRNAWMKTSNWLAVPLVASLYIGGQILQMRCGATHTFKAMLWQRIRHANFKLCGNVSIWHTQQESLN